MKRCYIKRILIFFFVVLIFLLSILIFFSKTKDYEKSYLKEILIEQKDIDKEISSYLKNKKYTIDNPKIIINPYKISPLTALIIFNTDTEENYNLYINNQFVGQTEKSKKHSIPIYGLLDSYENIIKIEGTTIKEYKIKTEKVDVGKMDVQKTSKNLNDDLYFLVGGQNPNNVAYDRDGNVRWFLTLDLAIDIAFLPNNRLLIGNGDGSSYVGYTGLLEIDYLGKIYKEYDLIGGTHHSIEVMPNGNFLIPTGTSAEEVSWDYIVELNPKTGKNVKEINLIDIFNEIDSTFVEKISGASTYAYNNSAYYDEKSNTLTLSLRKLNSIININYDTLELNWIYGEKEYWTDLFNEYFLERMDDSRISYGQHSVYFKNETFGMFDNHILDIFNKSCKELLSLYSSADIYKIEDNKFKLTWSFQNEEKDFAPYLSSLTELTNGNKLINYGYVIDKELLKGEYCDLDLYVAKPITKIYEVNDDKKVLFEAELKDQAKQFAYKNSMYKEKINNFEIEKFKIYRND